MASKPKTKFDNWLLTQYEVKEPTKVSTPSVPEHRRLYRRDFDKVITSCEYADELQDVEPTKIISKGNFVNTIVNDQQITEHQTTLQNQQVNRNNIWTYGVHRNEVPVYETPDPPTCSPKVLGQAGLSTWHKIKREEAIENEVPRDSFKRKTFFTKPLGETLDEIDVLEHKINRLY